MEAKEYPFGKGPVKWVSTEWLEGGLNDENLMILDVQPNIHDYLKEHVPGAVYLNEEVLRCPLKGVPSQFDPPEAVQPIFRRTGLKRDLPVAVYTGTGGFRAQGDGLEQTMMAYSIARYGHDNIYVLDGGLEKWKKEKRPLAQEFPRGEESDFAAHVRSEYFVGYDEFNVMRMSEDVMVIDARPTHVYEGQGPWMKAGHIPGAISLPWPTFMHPDNTRLFKSDQEIHAILNEHGVDPDKTIIWYCGTGREATNPFILFKFYLGFPNVKIYEGSFTEWSAYPDAPTVTGRDPY